MPKRLFILCSSSLMMTFALVPQESGNVNRATILGRITLLPVNTPALAARMSVYQIADVNSSLVEARFLRSVLTDSGGNYRFDDLSGGIYLVKVQMPGFSVTRVWDVAVSSGTVRILDISIRVTDADYFDRRVSNEIVGMIKSSEGNPVVDVTVIAIDSSTFGPVFQARSDSTGWYKLELPHGGRYVLYCLKSGFNLSPTEVEVPAHRRFDVILKSQSERK